MKGLLLTFTSSFFTILIFAQDKTIFYKDFRIDGLYFITKKETVIEKFGKPIKVFKPDYECGFLSDGQPGGTYYSLQYPYIKFTGNKLNYQLEEVLFNSKMQNKITYRKQILSFRTTKKEFEKIFGVKLNKNEITLRHKDADDALVFSFTNGLLAKIEYWSPC
jgi:hypothetical protein